MDSLVSHLRGMLEGSGYTRELHDALWQLAVRHARRDFELHGVWSDTAAGSASSAAPAPPAAAAAAAPDPSVRRMRVKTPPRRKRRASPSPSVEPVAAPADSGHQSASSDSWGGELRSKSAPGSRPATVAPVEEVAWDIPRPTVPHPTMAPGIREAVEARAAAGKGRGKPRGG